MNILVTGSNGQLGSELRELKDSITKVNFIFTDVNELDITKFDDVKSFFSKNEIGIILNCAAYTAVDKAENDYKNARLVNVYGVSNLAEMSDLYKIPIIHISTDYVYGGTANRPMEEDFPENPQSAYGKTKFDGEEILMATSENYLTIRTSWLYSSFGNNFVKTMLKLGKEKSSVNVVYDQIGTPTYAYDLANVIITIIHDYISTQNFKAGIYHYSNEGVCSWYDFTLEIMSLAKLNCEVNPILSKDFPAIAERPSYSVLNKFKIKNTFNIKIPHWKTSLEKCLIKLV